MPRGSRWNQASGCCWLLSRGSGKWHQGLCGASWCDMQSAAQLASDNMSPSHHIKIIFWTLRAFLSQMILTLKLSISHIIKKDQVLPSVGQQKLKYPFSQNSLADVLIKNLCRSLLLFPFQKRWKTWSTGAEKMAISPLSWWESLLRGNSAILFLEARTQRICLCDEEMILWS